jgi:hypothetical protein
MSIVGSIAWLLVYWIVFTPLSLTIRLFGRDRMNLRRASVSGSYWQARTPKAYRKMTSRY